MQLASVDSGWIYDITQMFFRNTTQIFAMHYAILGVTVVFLSLLTRRNPSEAITTAVIIPRPLKLRCANQGIGVSRLLIDACTAPDNSAKINVHVRIWVLEQRLMYG
jgi:hypothetical protein